jgi:integrase/recombinase XerD
MKAANLPANATDLAEVDNFCDALWLEDGLAKATLDSYRSDLGRLSLWLANNAGEPLLDIRETTLTAFIAHLSRQTRASSQARYLSTLRRFYRWQLGRGRIFIDPTLKLANPARPRACPRSCRKNRSTPCSPPPISIPRSACATAPCWKRSTPPACAFPNWSI